jgi:[protein-PII] uridylyltransferase
VLSGEAVNLRQLIARQSAGRSLYAAYFGERIDTQIRFDNDASDDRTLIEIETEDRLGLLYTISQTFSELELDISAARIVTERGAAVDSFYVREIEGGKIDLPGRRAEVEKALRSAIGQLEAPE